MIKDITIENYLDNHFIGRSNWLDSCVRSK